MAMPQFCWRRRRFDLHTLDTRDGRATAARCDHSPDSGLFARYKYLDRAIAAVAYPTFDGVGMGFVLDEGAKANTLHLSVNPEADEVHGHFAPIGKNFS